ncbi:MAG: thiamine pyrophosphate-dependent enzyme, partial [Acidobacteriota bacterium]
YARFAKVPMLEPADSQECRAFTRMAFELSEQFDTPVMLRSCTRISHGKAIVTLGERVSDLPAPTLARNPAKLVMLPSNARLRHPVVEERIVKLAGYGDAWEINRTEYRSTRMGVICAWVIYQYVREVLPEASVLKLGMVHPLPRGLIRAFADRVEKLYVIEELDPFIEEQVRAMGIAVTGKEIIPLCGELTPGRIREAFNLPQQAIDTPEKLPGRPPNMCPGCPHRGVFHALGQLKAYVVGDIGCYTLGFMPPLNAMDTCLCMGASISNASGIARVLPPEEQKKVVAVIGDSTFLHTGVNSLMEMAYNQIPATVIILDNRTTAMTGRQDNPASGFTLTERAGETVDLVQLVRALGIHHIRMINPLDLSQTRAAIEEEMNRPEPSVIITDKPCVLIKREGVFRKGAVLAVDEEQCSGCRACLKIGCPAIEWRPRDGERGNARIDPRLCTGCDVCRQLCKFDSIGEAR